jgi:hypothetical protein
MDVLDSDDLHCGLDGGRQHEIFTMLLRIVKNLNLMNCILLEFSIKYFQTMNDSRPLKPWKTKL